MFDMIMKEIWNSQGSGKLLRKAKLATSLEFSSEWELTRRATEINL